MNRVSLYRIGNLCSLLVFLAFSLAGCSKPTPEERFEEALALLQEGQTARGVMKFREIVRDLPDDPMANQSRLILARYYVSEGNAARAIEQLAEVFEAAQFSEPHVQNAFEGLTSIYLQINEVDKALALYDEVIARLPEGSSDRSQMEIQKYSIVLETDKEEAKEAALDDLRVKMLEAEEKIVRGYAREQLAQYFRRQQEYEKSNEVYEAYLEEYPDDTLRRTLELAMATNVIMSGEEEEGLEMFEETAQEYIAETEEILESAKRADEYSNLAQMYMNINQLEKAEELYRKIMAENVQSRKAIEAQLAIANMYTSTGLRQLDRAIFDKGIAVFGQIAEENRNTNIEQTANRNIEEAKAAFERMTQQRQAMEEAAEAAAREGAKTAEPGPDGEPAAAAEEPEEESAETP